MICDQGFEHPDPEPVIIEEAPDTEPIAEAEVRIAEIEADRDVTIAKIENRAADEELLAAVAALTAENEALRAQLAPPEPEPGEIAVVVANADAEAAPEPEMAPPAVEETTTSEPPSNKRANPWWLSGLRAMDGDLDCVKCPLLSQLGQIASENFASPFSRVSRA